jgi:hypothetical protein
VVAVQDLLHHIERITLHLIGFQYIPPLDDFGKYAGKKGKKKEAPQPGDPFSRTKISYDAA